MTNGLHQLKLKGQKSNTKLLDNKDFLLESTRFNINKDQVDVFYSCILDSSSTMDLEKVMKLILIISQGNARVESGFSVVTSCCPTCWKKPLCPSN